MGLFLVFKSLLSLQTKKTYLESVYMINLLFLPNSKVLINAISSANWIEVPGGEALASIVW